MYSNGYSYGFVLQRVVVAITPFQAVDDWLLSMVTDPIQQIALAVYGTIDSRLLTIITNH